MPAFQVIVGRLAAERGERVGDAGTVHMHLEAIGVGDGGERGQLLDRIGPCPHSVD